MCVCYVRTAVNYNKIVTFAFLQTLFLCGFFYFFLGWAATLRMTLTLWFNFGVILIFIGQLYLEHTYSCVVCERMECGLLLIQVHLFTFETKYSHRVRHLMPSQKNRNTLKLSDVRQVCFRWPILVALSEHIEFLPKSTCFSTHIRVFGKLCSWFCDAIFGFWIKLIFRIHFVSMPTRNLSRNPLNRFYQWSLCPYASDLRSIIKCSVFVFTASVILLI